MEDHLIAFIDLLGFRSIITEQDHARQKQVLALLTSLVAQRGDFTSESRSIGPNTHEHSIRPAISAFSDHIVFSFPAAGSAHTGSGPITFYLAAEIARIFNSAIEFGCLVRGGIAFGQLHHAGDVVFGPGLVEAYELESKFAGPPRIIVSAGAAQKLGSHPYLHLDEDGFLYLDYVRAAFDGPLGTHLETDARRKWIVHIRGCCEKQITALTKNNNLGGLQKWRWFAARFERFVANLHPSISGEAAGLRSDAQASR